MLRSGWFLASFKKKKNLLRAMCTQLKSYDEKVSDSPQQLYPNKIISRKGQRSKALGGDMSAVQKKKVLLKPGEASEGFNNMISLDLWLKTMNKHVR